MPTIVTILLSCAAFLTALFIPLTFFKADSNGLNAAVAGIGLVLLSIIRASVMILAMKGVSSGTNLSVAVAAVVMTEIASCSMHFAAADAGAYDHIPYQYGFEAAATLLPALLIVAGFLLGSNSSLAPKALWAAAILPLIAGGLGFIASNNLAAARTLRIDQRAEQVKKRMAELNVIPASADVETLLPFAAGSEDYTVQVAAKSRIIDADRAVEQLKAALDGPNREAAKLIFKEVERAVYRKKKEAEFKAVPPTAGLAAVLSFYSSGEAGAVRDLVEDRLRDTPDGETQLVKALAGPHALEAIDLLRRVDKYRLESSTYAAAFAAAAKIATRLNAAERPPEPQVEALVKAIGLLAERCGEEALKKHRQELMTVYEMSRRAEKEYGYRSHYMDLELALGLR